MGTEDDDADTGDDPADENRDSRYPNELARRVAKAVGVTTVPAAAEGTGADLTVDVHDDIAEWKRPMGQRADAAEARAMAAEADRDSLRRRLLEANEEIARLLRRCRCEGRLQP